MADIIKYPKAGSSDTALAVDTSGNATIGGTITNTAQLVTTSGASGTLTPTSSVMIVTIDQAYAAALANPSAAGQRLTIINTAATDIDITIADASNLEIAGSSVVLEPEDTVEFVAKSAAVWVQVGTSNN